MLTGAEKAQLIGEATSIVGENPAGKPYQYPGFSDTDSIWDNLGPDVAPPTSMAIFPAGNGSGGETKHPERFFTLLEANLAETADVSEYLGPSSGNPGWYDLGNQITYSRNGLYVSGWELVDNNGIEIDPRTAALVFPTTGSPIQPVTNGQEFVAFGGGWYLNVAPPSPYQGSDLYATQANPSEVYLDWFHQASLVPASPVSGTLNYGSWGDDYYRVKNPNYSVTFYPIDPVPPPSPVDAIADQGFERVQVGAGQFLYDPTGSPWTFTPQNGTNGSGIAANGSAFTAGNPSAPEGVQVAFLQGYSSFSQDVPGWTAGAYQLTFEAAQRANWGTSQQDFNVLVDGVLVGHFQPSGTSYQAFTTAPFTVAAGPHTITFQGLSSSVDDTAFIDQVVLVEVTGQPPIADPSFEQVSVGAGGFLPDPTGSPWSFSGSAGISGNNSGYTSSNPPPPEGSQVAVLQQTGSLSQTVSDWAAGSYQLAFKAAQRGDNPSHPSQQDFQVLVDGTVVGTFKPSGTSYQTYTTVPFTVTAGYAHDHVPGIGRCRRRQHRPHRPGRRISFIIGRRAADRRSGFRASTCGGRPVPAPPDRLSVVVLRHRRDLGQQQRLHLGEPTGPQAAQVPYLQGGGSWFSQDVPGWATGPRTRSPSRPPSGATTKRRRSRTSRCWSTGPWWGRSSPPARRTRPTPLPRSPSPPGRTRSRSGDWTAPAATTPPSSTRLSRLRLRPISRDELTRDTAPLRSTKRGRINAPISPALPRAGSGRAGWGRMPQDAGHSTPVESLRSTTVTRPGAANDVGPSLIEGGDSVGRTRANYERSEGNENPARRRRWRPAVMELDTAASYYPRS